MLPRDPTLLRELAGLRFEEGERGFTRIEADSPARHDDVADALYLSAGLYRAGRGLRSALRARAEPGSPDAGVPTMADAETVTTGAGLVVWRRPALQSVAGEELSAPPGAAVVEPGWIRRVRAAAGPNRKEVNHG